MLKKKYGQNFLIDQNISEKILFKEKVKDQNILEIGTGNLALTKSIILRKPKKFLGVEIDEDLYKIYHVNNLLDKIIFGMPLRLMKSTFNNQNFSITQYII